MSKKLVIDSYLGLKALILKCEKENDFSKLKEVDLRKIKEDNLEGLFENCRNLKNLDFAKDWDISNISSISNMFKNCVNLEDISGLYNWDVSRVIIVVGMFRNCIKLKDISALSIWRLSNVIDMSEMFRNCPSINDIKPINKILEGNLNQEKILMLKIFFDSNKIKIYEKITFEKNKDLNKFCVKIYKQKSKEELEKIYSEISFKSKGVLITNL
ncbi:BspA family leucine-rich repeat surface protein [bacterium]|nr:BspA family leucine-rich repeat surface protein [bacterium]